MSNQVDRVLVTGASGFIAKHIVLQLLEEGYAVRGTVRSTEAQASVISSIGGQGVSTGRFDLVRADLTRDEGWDAAMDGCRFVVHTASPFPASLPKDKFALVPIAQGGAVRVLGAATRAGVERVVMTSSVAAVYYGHAPSEGRIFGEADFSDTGADSISAYAVSKTMAELAAWEAVAGQALELSVINPALVLGPLLDRSFGTSAGLVRSMMRGRLPLIPDIAFGIVDVRDVALAHVRAMTAPEAAGRRFILSGGLLSLSDIARIIRAAYPALSWKLPLATLPKWVIIAAAIGSSSAAQILPEVGPLKHLDVDPAKTILRVVFRSPETAVEALAASLFSHRLC